MRGYRVDAFTTEPGRGNPAAVVLDAGGLTGADLAGIAARLGLETTFVDGTTLRYYMPEGQPMNLCGHGTIAALAVMGREGRFSVETPAGELGVEVQPYLLGMAMPVVTFGEPVGADAAAEGLGAHADARQFPAGGGILEDPVTGTAAVALAWYLWRHGLAPGCGALKIEQGHAMGRPGQVLVKQEPGGHAWIYGQAVVARTMEV